jgi:transcriptional regulator with XRE-family HTH domain
MTPTQLRQWRLRHNLTEKAAAELIGTTPNTWALWERGERGIRHGRLLDLALTALDSMPAELEHARLSVERQPRA